MEAIDAGCQVSVVVREKIGLRGGSLEFVAWLCHTARVFLEGLRDGSEGGASPMKIAAEFVRVSSRVIGRDGHSRSENMGGEEWS